MDERQTPPPRIRGDLVYSPQETRDGRITVIKDPRTMRYFRVREPEEWLIRRLDGAASSAQLADEFRVCFGYELPVEQIDRFIGKLDELYFLETARADYETSRTARREFDRGKSLLTRALRLRLVSFDPSGTLDTLVQWYRPLHGPALFIGVGGLTTLGLLIFGANLSAFQFRLAEVFHLGSLLTVATALAFVIALHELGHALTLRFLGGSVHEVGFMLLYGEPCFYTDLSDAWLLPERRQRMATLCAGPLVQIVTLALAALVWRVAQPFSGLAEIARTSVVVAWVTLAFNLNPFIKLDGYYLLSDWLDIPNLRDKAFTFWRVRLGRAFLGLADGAGAKAAREITTRERRVFGWYFWFAGAYSVALILWLTLALGGILRERLGGWGVILLAALLGVILRQEIGAMARYLASPVTAMKNIFKSKARAAAYLLGFLVFGLVFFVAPAPHRIGADVTFRAIDQFTVSVGEGGQLRASRRTWGEHPDAQQSYLNVSALDLSSLRVSVRARPGDTVRVGDTVVTLESNHVIAELSSARHELFILQASLALLRSPPKPESLQVLEASVSGYKTDMERLQSELKRKRELSAKNLISLSELDRAQAEARVAESHWREAVSLVNLLKSPPKREQAAVIETNIERQHSRIRFLESQAAAQVITTPVGGQVIHGLRPDDLVTVIDDSRVEAIARVSDYDIDLVKAGAPVSVKVRSYPSEMFSGSVCRVSVAEDEGQPVGGFEVAVVVQNREGRIRPGMSGYQKITVGQSTIAGLATRKIGSLVRVEFWSWW